MTNEEMRTIATMVAEMMTSQKPSDAPQPVSEVKADPTPTNDNPDAISVPQQAAEEIHKPAITPEQLAEILNDVRLEQRAQFKQPWVEALNATINSIFHTPAVYGSFTPEQQRNIVGAMNQMIENLKKSGKFWPQIVSTCLNQDGERQYVNASYKRADGDKWKVGSILKPQA